MQSSGRAPIIPAMPSPDAQPSLTSRALWLVLPLMGGFQIWAASYYTVFDDEAFSCRLYALPLGEMLSHLREGSDPDPPLYYIIENIWVHVVGIAPLALRLPSIVFFLIGCWCTVRAAECWWGPSARVPALLVTALHPAHLFFGFAARWYALAFCLVAALNWITAIIWRSQRVTNKQALGWGLLAGAALLTNYFLIAVVALHGMVLLLGTRRQQQWTRAVVAAAVAIVVFIPWSGPFVSTLQTFRDSSPAGSTLSTSVRLLMVLLTGNLASPRAWWTWIVAGVFGLAILWRVSTHGRLQHPAIWMPLILLLVGIVTRTLIDKYVMTISGLCCVALAGLLSRVTSRASSPSPGGAGAPVPEDTSRALSATLSGAGVTGHIGKADKSIAHHHDAGFRPALQLSLIALWLTCGVHLVTERYWSSLRWRDPLQQVVGELLVSNSDAGEAILVASHPSARYYAALAESKDATVWLRAWQQQDHPDSGNVLLPSAFLERAAKGMAPDKVQTLQTSGFANLPDWDAALDRLQRHYIRVDETPFLEDPDAELKDRLDPTIHHARYRITVQQWRRRTSSASP